MCSLTNWRAVSATGASEMLVRSFLLLFQSASLLEHLYPGRCPGLYSYWAFSPSLLVPMIAAQYSALYSFSGFAPPLLVILVTARCAGLYSYWGFAPSSLTRITRIIFLLHRSNDHLHKHLSVCKSVKKFNSPSQYSRICNQEQDCAQIRRFCKRL